MLKSFLLLGLCLTFHICFSQNPLVQFPFNATFKDTGFNKILGVAFGNPKFGSDFFNAANKAIEFDGIDDYIDLDTNKNLKPTSLLTFVFWAYSDNWSGYTNSPTLAGNTEGGGYGIMINNTTNDMEAKAYIKGAFVTLKYALSNLTNGWHQFGLTFSNGVLTFYVDGKSVGFSNQNQAYLIGYSFINNKFIVGDESSSTATPEGKRFKGKMDDLRFYTVGLTATEMQTLFSTTSSVFSDVMLSQQIIYPNPIKETINIQLGVKITSPIKIQYFQLDGKLILENTLAVNADEISIARPSNIHSGLYLMKISTQNELILTKKISFE